jgi:methanogenic corrinoid protein MtbC1
MNEESVLKSLEDCVALRDIAAMERMVKEFDQLSKEPSKIMDALCRGMERARKNSASKDSAVTDLLLSIDCFRIGADRVAGLEPDKNQAKGPGVVIGVVEGDVHHMGKNIVAAVLSANGFMVYDAGRDVPASKFLEMVRETSAKILALSVMMSTPQNNMAELVRAVRLVSPSTRVIVGGASMDAELGKLIGADGYAENATTVPEEFFRVLSMKTNFSRNV